MIHPVTVKDNKGNTIRIITSGSLEERSTAICKSGDGHFASHKLRESMCGREECRTPFWTKQRGKRYCSKECTIIVSRSTALATKERRKQRLLEEKN